MQDNFETLALAQYDLFIHKQAHMYHKKYATCSRFGCIDYDEYYQEAALGFVDSLRLSNEHQFPISPRTIGCAKQLIRQYIFRHLILSYDGIHRLSPSATAAAVRDRVLSSLSTDNMKLFDSVDSCGSMDDVELLATIDRLPPAQSIVAICLINGLSRREIVRRNILSRRATDHAIDCLRVIFA